MTSREPQWCFQSMLVDQWFWCWLLYRGKRAYEVGSMKLAERPYHHGEHRNDQLFVWALNTDRNKFYKGFMCRHANATTARHGKHFPSATSLAVKKGTEELGVLHQLEVHSHTLTFRSRTLYYILEVSEIGSAHAQNSTMCNYTDSMKKH